MTARTALITGATSGIGAAFARRLAADGLRPGASSPATGSGWPTRPPTSAETHGVAVEVLPADLATEAGRDLVADRLPARAARSTCWSTTPG